MFSKSGKIDTKIIIGFCVGIAIIAGIAAVIFLDSTGQSGSGLPKEYTYDVTELGKVDPALILYDEIDGPVKTGFAKSTAITVSGDKIFAAGDESVRIFNTTGVIVGRIELEAQPQCIAVSDDDLIYVAFKEHVEIFDRTGSRIAQWGSLGQKAFLTSITAYKDNVFVADAGNRQVVRYGKDGNILNYIGRKDPDRNIPGFVIPSNHFDLAVADDGLLRVVNPGRHLIEAYTFDGDREFAWGTASMGIEGFCGCCNPANFAIAPDGGFVTAEKGLVRIKIYDAEGNFVGVVASPEQLVREGSARVGEVVSDSQRDAFDVAVDEHGRIYVLDTINNIIRVFQKKASL